MKNLTFVIVVFGLFVSLFLPAGADAGEKVEIKAISHAVLPEAKETITFKLSGPAAPKIFTIKGGNPRLVIDFPGAIYRGKGSIALPEGKLATAVRTGLHQKPEEKVRVVIDLAKDVAVRHSAGAYDEAGGTITVTLDPGPREPQEPEKETAEPTAAEPPPEKALPSPQELAARPLHEKPVPPVLHRKEEKEAQPVPEKTAGPEPPQLLDITFDDSSSKGEMVLFHLNDFYPPTVSAVEKDTPRVFCDFMEMKLGAKVQESILTKGKYVQRIRTAKHRKPDKVQVILELSPDRDYDLQQVFFKNDNLFVLIVNEMAPQKTETGQSEKKP